MALLAALQAGEILRQLISTHMYVFCLV